MLPGENDVTSPKSSDVIMRIEEEVDLLSYVYAVFDGKWFILVGEFKKRRIQEQVAGNTSDGLEDILIHYPFFSDSAN